MEAGHKKTATLDERYAAGLKDFLQRNDESSLVEAYQAGRQCLEDGRALLEMMTLHLEALQEVLAMEHAPVHIQQTVERAGRFLIEALAPYEMTNRAFNETHEALSQLNETVENETRRIAHMLHDDAGQLLAVAHVKLNELARGMQSRDRERLQEVRLLLDRVEDQMRSLSHEIRSPVLEEHGVAAALQNLASSVFQRSGVKVSVEGYDGVRLPAMIEAVIYRAVQEALKNVVRHAHAQHAQVLLRRSRNAVSCLVEDDGCGFDKNVVGSGASPKGLGLLGIQERVQALQGDFEIHSVPGKGTKLYVKIPLEV